jgi:hypothetical protein
MIVESKTHNRIKVAALDRVLQFINDHPDKHEQNTWLATSFQGAQREAPQLRCNTIGCVAGWTAILAGYEPYWGNGTYDTELVTPLPNAEPIDDGCTVVDEALGTDTDVARPVYDVRSLALTLLGLTDNEADVMFEGHNTIYDMWRIAERITQGAVVPPPNARRGESDTSEDEFATFGTEWGVNDDGRFVVY